MNNKDFTIPKNLLLNWLYSTERYRFNSQYCFLIKSNIQDTRHVSLDKLGKWIEQNTGGKYKLVDTDTQAQSI